MAFFSFDFRPNPYPRFSRVSDEVENTVVNLDGKAFLVGKVKVRIFGITFTIILKPEHYRSLAYAFNDRVRAVHCASLMKKTGDKVGNFTLDDVKRKDKQC